VSPIISNAPKASADAGAPEDPERDAAAQFEGLLFASALEPLSRSIGMLGDVLTGAVSTAVARSLHDDLYRRLQTQIDADRTP
jgi:hypothetical protein